MTTPVTSPLAAAQAALERLAPRERSLVFMAGGLLSLALIWWTLLAPALQTWRESSTAHAKLDAQLAQMQALAQEAKRLKAAPVVSPKEAENWLNQSVKKLGKASVTLPAGGLQAGVAQISFVGADAAALAVWLSDARTAAGLLPTQAYWTRQPPAADKPHATGNAPPTAALWGGSVTLRSVNTPPATTPAP